MRRSTIKHLVIQVFLPPFLSSLFIFFQNRKWSLSCVTTCPSCRRRSTPVRICRPASRLCSSCCSAAASTLSWPWRMSTTPPAKTPTRSGSHPERRENHDICFMFYLTERYKSGCRILCFFFSNLKVFHTRNKQGVVIHPTSVFASDPEVLHVPEEDIRETGERFLTKPSGQHSRNGIFIKRKDTCLKWLTFFIPLKLFKIKTILLWENMSWWLEYFFLLK